MRRLIACVLIGIGIIIIFYFATKEADTSMSGGEPPARIFPDPQENLIFSFPLRALVKLAN